MKDIEVIKQTILCLGEEMKKAREEAHEVEALAIEKQLQVLLWVIDYEGNGDLMQATEAQARDDVAETSETEQVKEEAAEPMPPSQPEMPVEYIPESIEEVPEEFIPREAQIAYNRKTEFKHFF